MMNKREFLKGIFVSIGAVTLPVSALASTESWFDVPVELKNTYQHPAIKEIKALMEGYNFEFNDVILRHELTQRVANILNEYTYDRNVDTLYDFKVVCDETNNTNEIIDDGLLSLTVYTKLSRSINYNEWKFIMTCRGFSE